MTRVCMTLGMIFLWAAACANGVSPVPEARADSASGACPQARTTPAAPPSFQTMKNPKSDSSAALEQGKTLFQQTSKPFTCKTCHGETGDGVGEPDFESTPPARNFTCAATMNGLSDGQLFWIIQNGSPNTAMPAFKGNLSDDDIWSLVTYIRSFARQR